jgi:hypothetical protein
LNRNFLISIAVLCPTFAFSSESAISAVRLEHKETAQERQAEIAQQRFCSEKADKEKVMKRDVASFVAGCMDAIEKAERAIKK